jgi:hypothetical protein
MVSGAGELYDLNIGECDRVFDVGFGGFTDGFRQAGCWFRQGVVALFGGLYIRGS